MKAGAQLFNLGAALILFGVSAAAAAEPVPVRILYFGAAEGSEWRGVELGLAEANHLGSFTGQSFTVEAVPPGAALEEALRPLPSAVVVAAEAAVVVDLATRLELYGVAVLNLAAENDRLRRACRRNLLHIPPSAGMKAVAVEQWHQGQPQAAVEARAWHPDFVKFAARDLNRRFFKAQGVRMDDGAWAGWAALKMVSETVARTASAEPARILDYLRSELAFDGQKGVAQTFHDTGQLRQPLLLVAAGDLVGEAPVRGVAEVDDLDSLILDACAAPARAVAESGPTHRAFVSNEKDGTLSVIDLASLEVESTVAVGNRPRGLGLSPDRSRVYVALGEDNAIAVVDTRTLEVVKTVPSGSDPEAFAVHPNGRIYLSNEDANKASALDPDSGEILAEIPVGIEPEGVGVSPDGTLVLVTSESTNMVHVIAVPEHEVIANILVGARPREVAFSADGRWAYVTSELAAQVTKIEVAGRAIELTGKIEIPKAKPKGILLSRDQRWLYVSTGRAGIIAVLDAETLELRHQIQVGRRVWGLALSADGRRLLACNGLDNTVSVIDTETRDVIATLNVGSAPWGVVIDD